MRLNAFATLAAAGLALGLATAALAVTPQGATPRPTPPGRQPTEEQWGPARPFPAGTLRSARIRLERTACYGTCPVYSVEIHGDGTVIWNGERFVKAMGARRYRIPVAKVRALAARFRAARFYSALEAYEGGVTDLPSANLTLTWGGVSKSVRDYAGLMAGMPHAVHDLELAVDEAAGTKALIGGPQQWRR